MKNLLKKFSNDETLGGRKAAILQYARQAKHNTQAVRRRLYAKSWKMADVYGKSIHCDIFIQDVNSYIYQSIREYWATQAQADIANIAFKAQSLLAIEKVQAKQPTADNRAATFKPLALHIWNENSENAFVTWYFLSSTRSFQQAQHGQSMNPEWGQAMGRSPRSWETRSVNQHVVASVASTACPEVLGPSTFAHTHYDPAFIFSRRQD